MIENPPAANPYAPPQATVDDVVAGVDAAARIRTEHLLHEVRLKSVGALYYFIAALMALASAMPLLSPIERSDYPLGAYVAIALGTALLTAFVGHGFRALRPWVRWAGGAMSILGLLNVPVGTLINAYILYLIFSAKGRTVLAADYAAILAATPTLKYRRTVGDWIAIGVLVAFIGLFVVAVATL